VFKIAICDDENLFTEELKELISGYMMEKGLIFEVDTYNSGEALVELGVGVVRYTVVFLDINMEKIDGIKTAEMIRKVSREVFIVFVTAYVDYSLEGYRLDVVRYLLKGNANFQSNVNECMDAIIDKMNYSVIKGNLTLKRAEKK
jgi:DNA-binding LytR/AlgR family response regulator